MIAGALSKRYARALVEAVAEPREPAAPEERGRDLEAAGRDLEVFARLLREHRDLRALFANPGVQRRDKETILKQLTAALALGPIVALFLELLLEKGRLGHLEIIAHVYQELVDERLGRVRAEIATAAPLEEAVGSRLGQRLATVAGRPVVLETRVDPGLLGGMVARIGGTVYDGSLRAQLAQVRQQMLRG